MSKMSTKGQQWDSAKKAKSLIVVAWIASLAALPLYSSAVVGWGMSPSTPTVSIGELLMLAAGPGIACAALFEATARCRVTAKHFAAMIVPGVLALAELTLTVMIWRNG